MSSPDKEFRIKIATEADATGAQETTQALDATASAAERAAEAAQDGEIISPAAAEAAKEVAEAMDQAAEAVERTVEPGRNVAIAQEDTQRAAEAAAAAMDAGATAASAQARAVSNVAASAAQAAGAAERHSAALRNQEALAKQISWLESTRKELVRAQASGDAARVETAQDLVRAAELQMELMERGVDDADKALDIARKRVEAEKSIATAKKEGQAAGKASLGDLDEMRKILRDKQAMWEAILKNVGGLPGGLKVSTEMLSNLSGLLARISVASVALPVASAAASAGAWSWLTENENKTADQQIKNAERYRDASDLLQKARLANVGELDHMIARQREEIQALRKSIADEEAAQRGAFKPLFNSFKSAWTDAVRWSKTQVGLGDPTPPSQADLLDEVIRKESTLETLRTRAMEREIRARLRLIDLSTTDDDVQRVDLYNEAISDTVAALKDMGVAAASPRDALRAATGLAEDQRRKVIELASEWQKFSMERDAADGRWRASLDAASAASKRAKEATEAQVEAYRKLGDELSLKTEADSLALLERRAGEVVAKLREAGVVASSPLEAYRASGRFLGEHRDHVTALITSWSKLDEAIAKSKDRLAGVALSVTRMEAELKQMRESGNDFVQAAPDREGRQRWWRKEDTTSFRGAVLPGSESTVVAANDSNLIRYQQLTRDLEQAKAELSRTQAEATTASQYTTTVTQQVAATSQQAAQSAQQLGDTVATGMASLNSALAAQPQQITTGVNQAIAATNALGQSVNGGFNAISAALMAVKAQVDQHATKIAGLERSSRK